MIQLKSSTLVLLALVTFALVGYVSLSLAFPVYFEKKHLIDFDIFYLVSTMIGEGDLGASYASETFLPRQAEMPGFDGFEMFWSYPPHFNLVVAPLSSLPLSVSYALFTLLTLTFYVMVIRALAGPAFHTIVALFLPLALLIMRSGQNSFLTGGLIGLTALLALQKSRWAGIPLGLMAIKPHLALGVGIWSLLDRRWRLAALSLVVVAILSLLATLAFGTDVWPTSLAAIEAIAEVLRDGRFPLFRMTSIYASALSFGIDHDIAMVLHLVVAIVALGALAFLRHIESQPDVLLGFGIFVSVLLSPYNYDYDLAMLAAAACLLFDTVNRHAGTVERCVIAGAILAVGAYGLGLTVVLDYVLELDGGQHVSILGPILIAAGILLYRIVLRGAFCVGDNRRTLRCPIARGE